MIQLGQHCKDVITGYEGLCMGRAQYLTGCNQVLLTPRELDKDGKRREGEWFDEQRVVPLNYSIFELPSVGVSPNPGLDEPLPPRHG